MVDYIPVWQCIGCGKIDAPQPCIGVCQDRKAWLIGKGEHEKLLAEADQLRQRLHAAHKLLQQLSRTQPREGQWQRCWLSVQEQAGVLLAADNFGDGN